MIERFTINENHRSVPVGQNILHVKREDPYGFWTCHFERGTIPRELEGTFTSFDEALKKISVYLERKEPEAVPPTPELIPEPAPEPVPEPTPEPVKPKIEEKKKANGST